MTIRSKQWYANASSSPNSLANSSIGLLSPLRLTHQQEHWDRGPVEINSAEDRDATDWNTRWFFSPAVRRAARKFQIFLVSLCQCWAAKPDAIFVGRSPANSRISSGRGMAASGGRLALVLLLARQSSLGI